MATNLLSATSVVSAYTAVAASLMVVKTVLNEIQSIACQIIPENVQQKIISALKKLFQVSASDENLTLNIAERIDGLNKNEIFEAAQTYLSTKISNSNKRLNVHKNHREPSLTVTIDNGELIFDSFEGITLRWGMLVTRDESGISTANLHDGVGGGRIKENKSMELTFHRQYKEKVLERYIPFILETATKIQAENRVIKLWQLNHSRNSINLRHPSTFDTLAMEPEVKSALIDDLDRFLRRRDFYRRVGKVWKRGYLLYGPPGTGKSSLIAAMANYLKFHIYDLDLSRRMVTDFRQLLVSTTNRSIIVIEDIDCSNNLKTPNRQAPAYDSYGSEDEDYYDDGPGSGPGYASQNQSLPLAGLLNFIDGLWSSCGDERIIIFTTNYKERLDPALLRPGRMDLHIHLSYLTFSGFKTLAYNYLNISNHSLFAQIEELIKEVQITPATVAEELMKSDDVDEVLEGFVQLLLKMKEGEQKKENGKPTLK